MGIIDKFKGKPEQSGDTLNDLPGMGDDPSVSRAQQAKSRSREQARMDDEENEGLPSVNRRNGNNKMVTILGFIFIIGAALALIVSVNGDKGPAKPKAKTETIANNMPPLSVPVSQAVYRPPAPPPIAMIEQTAPPMMIRDTKPIKPSGPEPLSWEDRKMGGNMLVGSGDPLNSDGAQRVTAVMDTEDPGQPKQVGTSANALGAQLVPTITKSVAASLLSDRNFLITKGTALDCALETALDSTVPGLTTCRLTRDVYSDNGQVLLLDRGSQLTGEYQGGIKQGQVRVFVLWSRAKTPNGVVVALDSPGTDALGRSGLDGYVDNHFMQRFGAAILMSFVNATTSALANRKGSNGSTVIYGPAANDGGKIIGTILESTVNIPPTIVKNQGEHIQVMVARDLDFSTVYGLTTAK